MGLENFPLSPQMPFRVSKKTFQLTTGLFCITLLLLIFHNQFYRFTSQREGNSHETEVQNANNKPNHESDYFSNANDTLRLLLPATEGGVDLCKTLLTAKILSYPTPGLIAWNESYSSSTQMTGGAHLAKIFGVLEYLNSMPSDAQSDIILMLDAYDIWFQLRPDVLLNRFHAINQAAQQRYALQGGESSPPVQKIIFAAGKRCAPNQLHTVACYPVPPSPLSADLYGNNTDTVIGRNKYTSHRQRYLNSGYIMGRVSDLRILFEAAAAEVHETPDHIPEDNGSGGSDFLYHGSDQSIFNTLFGRQEYMREVRRREAGGKPQPTTMEGIVIDDILNPPFTHEQMPNNSEGGDSMKWEFGIGLDYFSDLGHQTVNSETDAKWMSFDEEPLDTSFKGRNRFDCEPRVTRQECLGDFETSSPVPFAALNGENTQSWANLNLYTNLCTSRVPVMVHHNGDKGARGYRWRDMWFQARSRELLQYSESNGQEQQLDQLNLAWTDKGDRLNWAGLCGNFDDILV